MQEAKSINARVTYDVNLRYLLQLPEGYGRSKEKWPMVLFLHGMGERGSDLELVKRHGPPKLVESGEKFPFILVSPQCPTDEFWSVPVLKSFMDTVEGLYAVDPTRRYLTGLSMGGNGAWRLAIAYPDHFAALAPICGWGDPGALAALKNLPIWVFHGMKDLVVPYDKSDVMVKSLQELGGKVRYTLYPEAEHDSWSRTYSDPAFFDWLLAQRLRKS